MSACLCCRTTICYVFWPFYDELSLYCFIVKLQKFFRVIIGIAIQQRKDNISVDTTKDFTLQCDEHDRRHGMSPAWPDCRLIERCPLGTYKGHCRTIYGWLEGKGAEEGRSVMQTVTAVCRSQWYGDGGSTRPALLLVPCVVPKGTWKTSRPPNFHVIDTKNGKKISLKRKKCRIPLPESNGWIHLMEHRAEDFWKIYSSADERLFLIYECIYELFSISEKLKKTLTSLLQKKM